VLIMLAALAFLLAAVGGVYWLLKSMGQDGIEAAAPGSCKSGRCGVPPAKVEDTAPQLRQVGQLRGDEIPRIDPAGDVRLPPTT
jgi:hypothetical protein